jgi:hypothetical protein
MKTAIVLQAAPSLVAVQPALPKTWASVLERHQRLVLNAWGQVPDREAMPLARASIVCLSATVLLLLVRGPSNWSRAFGVTWYGLFLASVVFAVAGLFVALLSRDASLKRRLVIVSLSVPALLAVPALIWAIVTLVPLAN